MGIIRLRRLRRLNESHENLLPDELLSMTVADLLDKVGELDSQGDAEYEVVEAALIALKDKLMGTGYPADEVDFTPDGVENAGDEEDEDKDPLAQQIETYDEIAGQQDLGQSQGSADNGGLDNFNF